MTIDKRSILPLTLVGGAVVVVLAWRRRHNGRRQEQRQQKTELQTWEGEGGNLIPPAAAPKSP